MTLHVAHASIAPPPLLHTSSLVWAAARAMDAPTADLACCSIVAARAASAKTPCDTTDRCGPAPAADLQPLLLLTHRSTSCLWGSRMVFRPAVATGVLNEGRTKDIFNVFRKLAPYLSPMNEKILIYS
jgi:hypothetical protein